MKPYLFNGERYNTLEELVKAYIKDFDLGVNDIYKNARKIYKFIRKTKNREQAQEFLRIITYSKYKNNALTFFIFMYDTHDPKQVYICGKPLSFDQFLARFKLYGNDKDNALYLFLEDHGISRTYAKLPYTDQKLVKDSYYLERYFDKDFTYTFLTTYYNFSLTDSLNGKVSSIAINGDECFRRASKVMASDNFMLAISHKLGFKVGIEIANEVNPIFYTIKALRRMNETDEDLLRKLLVDTFYEWLLDNLDKYMIVKKDAKQTFKNLENVGDIYKRYKIKVLHHELDDISLDLLCDLHREIYLNYLNFVTLYKNGSIIVKNKFSSELYGFTKPYAMTYITLAYMNGRAIKLYHPEENDELKASFNKAKSKVVTINPYTGKEDANGVKIDPLTGRPVDNTLKEEDIVRVESDSSIKEANALISEFDNDDVNVDPNIADDDVNIREMIDVRDINIGHDVELKTKVFTKLKSLAIFLLILSIIGSLALVSVFVLEKFTGPATMKEGTIKKFLVAGGISLVNLFASILFLIIVKNGIHDLNEVIFIVDSRYKNILTPEEEFELYKQEKKGFKVYKVLKRTFIIPNVVSFVTFGAMVGSLGVVGFNLTKLVGMLGFEVKGNLEYLISVVGPMALGVVLSIVFFKRRNVLLGLLLFILSIGLGVLSWILTI